ncbi:MULTISPECIES: ABC transporter permease [unclassified Luteococcus]|uniref:ABC transporter permease n=1 Tax=unclassified Luteococcus TaxID=2639923 RepID=UPI00313C41BB
MTGPTTNPSLPRWLYLPAGLAMLLAALPILGLLVRIPWTRLVELVGQPESVAALRLSLLTCTASLVLVVLFGLPLAVLLARTRGPLAQLGRVLAVLPMVLPPVVAGLALLVTLGRRGLLGAQLSAWGVEIGFTTLAVVLGQTFVAMPYFVVALEGALRTLDPEFERVAATLGASPTRTLTRVTLPLLAPALIGGAAMAFARALGEFGATLTFAGSLPGVTQTLPQAIYLTRESDPDGALALSFVLLVLAVVLMGLSGWAARRQPHD